MAEAGIDISRSVPREWTREIIETADVVVTMGCGDTCPVVPGVAYEDWPIPDPAGRSASETAPIRDEIRNRVADLFARLGLPTPNVGQP